MTTVVVFNGQGAEYAGMGRFADLNSLIFKETLDQAQTALPFDLRGYLFVQQPLVKQPAALQPALVAYQLATFKASRCQADTFIGLSLGEYAALCAGGMLSLEDTMQVVYARGLAMSQAIGQHPGRMLALRLQQQEVPAMPKGVWRANHNALTQLVVGGEPEAIATYETTLRQAGIKFMPLPVAGAFHTPLMAGAQPVLAQALAACQWQEAHTPVVSTTSQAPFTPATVASTLTAQLTHATDLAYTVGMLGESGATQFIEISPKPQLAKLIAKQLPQVMTQSIAAEALNEVIT